ncbi:MAG TPA: WecB/TagA/CpsF family glycosyltransferase [Acidimicrobiales bacterium]|nr:WecB/TagA/CpsF family glycosyltransferase [Acidimicrobiales bacterium]
MTKPALTDPAVQSFVVCGVRIDAFQIDTMVDRVLAWKNRASGRAVHLCNAYTLSLALRDDSLRELLNGADANLSDGMPLVWIARRLGLAHMRDRVYGPDLMVATIDRGRVQGLRHYLYGSTPEVIAQLETNLRQRYPGTELVGAESGPFRPLTETEELELARRIADAGADVVWVGLGTPRQDLFVDRFRDLAPATFIAIGAAFDFHAGTKRQAPRVVQRFGFEWLFRLITEPRRLWKRYLIGNGRFVWAVLRRRPRLTTPTV